MYWPIRAVFMPFFLIYFRLQREGRENLPASGPLLLAANHRSFLDPFVIGAMLKRPLYYMVGIPLYWLVGEGRFATAFYRKPFWRFWFGAPVGDLLFLLGATGPRKSVSLEITGLGELRRQ